MHEEKCASDFKKKKKINVTLISSISERLFADVLSVESGVSANDSGMHLVQFIQVNEKKQRVVTQSNLPFIVQIITEE